MDTTIISAEEAAEFGEFKRSRREEEISLLLKKAIVDASRRETDRYALKNACDTAKKLGVHGVLVSPVNVAAAHKFLEGCECIVVCRVGGTGESLPAVKRAEAKRAARQGARELYLSPCYVALDDRELGEDDVALGVRAAKEAKADGVCVRGEAQLILRALTVGAGKLNVHCFGVENAAQLRTAVRAGATHACTRACEEIAEELYASLGEGVPQTNAAHETGEDF